MSETQPNNSDRPTTRIDDLVHFYRSWYHDDIARFAQNDEDVFEVSYADLRKACPDIADDYLKDPETIIDSLEEALGMIELPVEHNLSNKKVRLVDFDEAADELTWTLGEYLPDDVASDFIFVRGQVTKASEPSLRPQMAIWECQRCGTRNELPQPPLQPLAEPHECSGCERQGPFVPFTDEMAETAVNHQLIRLQPPPEKAQEAGEDSLEIVLEEDLVRSCSPGDAVTIASEMDTLINEGGQQPTLEFRARADTVEVRETDFSDIDYTEHLDDIEAIADSVDPYEKIVDSILPSHYGDRDIKEAIAYQLFGGVEKKKPDGSVVRGTIHIFLVGDPGVGKSTLMRYVDQIAPRSVFTTGTGSTSAGLTCSAVQDDFGDGGWTLEAGALVEAHNGICLIDELDDMDDEDQAGMLEAMSDRKISVSKAGENATLPANTSVLAGANPKFGRFDRYEPLGEQVDIHDALFSRFDLIFPMTDQPDPDHDRKVAEQKTRSAQVCQADHGHQTGESRPDDPEIPEEVLRAYIAYAREMAPVLTDDAAEYINREYVRIRDANDDDGPVPQTPRILESLIRLSEASARIRLSERITVDDVKRALDLYMRYIKEFGIDPESGDMDADHIETGTTQTQRDRIKQVRKVIHALEQEYNSGAPHEAVVDHVNLDEWDRSTVEHEIDNLKDKGEIYEPRDEHYRTT